MKKYETILVKKDADIAKITLNRISKLNAINKQMLYELVDAVSSIEKDKLRFVIFTGSGDTFCAGGDIKELVKSTPKDSKERSLLAEKITTKIEDSSKVYIAKIDGYCLGGGLELAMSCDYRIATENAKFGQPEGKLGIIPGYGALVRLPRLVGYQEAKKILIMAEIFDAKKALEVGLVDSVVLGNNIDKEIQNLINIVGEVAPDAIFKAKNVLNETIHLDIKKGLKLELETCAKMFGTKQQKEGMKAFLEKRKPKWQL